MNKKMAALLALALLPLASFANAATPPVLLVSASTQPGNVSPGDAFTLKLKIKNAGGEKAEGVTANLDILNAGADTSATVQDQKSSGGAASTAAASAPVAAPISVTGESNVRFLDSIKAGEVKEADFKMIADGAAKSGTYNLSVRLDHNGVQQTQIVGLIIVRKADIRIANVSIPARVKVGQEVKLTADIANAGNFAAKGVSLGVSGEGAVVKTADYFVGALDPSDADNYETTLKFSKAGEATLTLNTSYSDDFNRPHSSSKAVKVIVEKVDEKPAVKESSSGFFGGFVAFVKAFLGLGESKG